MIKNADQQQMLFNPPWFLKQVGLVMQINISTLKPMWSLFLSASHARWLDWLHGQTPPFFKRNKRRCDWNHRDLGVLNCTDAEGLINRSTTTSDLSKLQCPLWSSLPALETNQWLLSDTLPQWETINERAHS